MLSELCRQTLNIGNRKKLKFYRAVGMQLIYEKFRAYSTAKNFILYFYRYLAPTEQLEFRELKLILFSSSCLCVKNFVSSCALCVSACDKFIILTKITEVCWKPYFLLWVFARNIPRNDFTLYSSNA